MVQTERSWRNLLWVIAAELLLIVLGALAGWHYFFLMLVCAALVFTLALLGLTSNLAQARWSEGKREHLILIVLVICITLAMVASLFLARVSGEPEKDVVEKAVEREGERTRREIKAWIEKLHREQGALEERMNPARLSLDYPLGYVLYATDGSTVDWKIGKDVTHDVSFSPDEVVCYRLTRRVVELGLPSFSIESRGFNGMIANSSAIMLRSVGETYKPFHLMGVAGIVEIIADTDLGVSWVVGFRRDTDSTP